LKNWFANSRAESLSPRVRRLDGWKAQAATVASKVTGFFQMAQSTGIKPSIFTRTRDIDWAQIDHSVYEALKNHPSLKRYVIAIPCDLTDRTGATGKGRTGWQHWEAHKKSGLRNIGDDIQKLLLSHGPRSSYETFLLHRRQMACVVIGLGKRNFPQSGLSAMPRRR